MANTNDDLVCIYLRDMGKTALLTREEEGLYAGGLREARVEMAKLMLGLPAATRKLVLDGEKPNGKQLWPMSRIEGCWDRLESLVQADSKLITATTWDKARATRRELIKNRDALLTANLRLVTHIAKRFLSPRHGMPMIDLVQEGNIGLMKAVEKFDHRKGYKFSTYAYWWIQQAITRAIADKSRTIRIPVHLADKLAKIHRAVMALERDLDREPTVAEVAEKAGLSIKQVEPLVSDRS